MFMPTVLKAILSPVTTLKASYHKLYRVLLLAPVLLLMACNNSDNTSYQPEFSTTTDTLNKEYIFGVHPQRNPKKLRAVFGPLVKYLNTHISDAHLVFEASRNFAVYDQKQASRQFDFALPNPYGTVKGIESGYHVFGKMGNEGDLRGLILVRRDSNITSITDLKGKTVSFPGPTALAATILPRYFLYSHGLDVNKDFKSIYVGSMESSLTNVYRGNVAAGTAYPPAWRDFIKNQPEKASELKVMWETEAMPDNSLMARDDVPQALVDQISQALFNMHKNKQGQAVLAGMDLTMFKPAKNEDYAQVSDFIKQYEKVIGPAK